MIVMVVMVNVLLNQIHDFYDDYSDGNCDDYNELHYNDHEY